MDFIREKTKEKPISKKKLFLKIGTAALCGLVFSIVVLVMLFIFMPMIYEKIILQEEDRTEYVEYTESILETEETEDSEQADTSLDKDSEEDAVSEDSEQIEQQGDIVIPMDFSLSVSDYQVLQDELYRIGNEVNKSIVTVSALSGENAQWAINPFESQGQGSGVIIAEDDNYLYILTEKKIFSDAEYIRVSFIDNTGAEATLLKYDGNTGIAILTVEKRQLNEDTKHEITVAVMGNSQEITNGSIVIALGSPLGTNYSILTGNITSIRNEIEITDKNYSVFTTDIIASESGSGVLINTNGEIIGIVMQSFNGAQGNNTLTAVEIDELKNCIDSLTDGKDIAYIGLHMSTVTEDISKDYEIPTGVYIKDVISDSPAMYAGLQSGDIIVEINGESVLTDVLYSEKISQLIPGTTCEITVKRQSGTIYYDVTCEVKVGILNET